MNPATEWTYIRVGDYYLPNLLPPLEPQIGIWGKRRREYLSIHRNPIYTGMLLAGTLNSHLAEVDRSAEEMLDRLTREMAAAESVTEELKARNQMEWVGRMNSIRSCVMETVCKELINA